MEFNLPFAWGKEQTEEFAYAKEMRAFMDEWPGVKIKQESS